MPEQRIEITQVRSTIGAQQAQRRTLRALGLRRRDHTVTQRDRPEVRGMLARVAHLVEVRYAGTSETLGIEPGQRPEGPEGSNVASAAAAGSDAGGERAGEETT